MLKQIDKKFLKKHNACSKGIRWFLNNGENNSLLIIKKLIKKNNLSWANWLIIELMNKKQCVLYAIFAAESVIHIHEKKYPNNNKPQKAIQAAKNYLKNPCKKTKNAAAAAYAASASTYAVYAASAAAYAAASTYAAAASTYAVYAACTAYDAAYADDAKKIQIKLLNYGIKILSGLKLSTIAENSYISLHTTDPGETDPGETDPGETGNNTI